MNWKISLWLIGALVSAAFSQVPDVENAIEQIEKNDVNNNFIENSGVDEPSAEKDITEENSADLENISESSEGNDSTDDNTDSNSEESIGYTTETTIASTLEVSTPTTDETTETTETTEGAVTDDIPDLVVTTETGAVRGIYWQGSEEIIAYLDIPYGKFNYSFGAPTQADSWEEIREVLEHNTRCPQLDGDIYVGDTDCLTVSIFTPPNPVNTSVLFYIHESDFTAGSGDPAIYGPEFLVPKNIILVLPNYRLGPLGFLCLRNSTAPGNAGLKDLALALEWTKNNIETFGGNPNNIAVSGDGTSAALAGYLAVSPSSRSFISKVITDSGSVLSHWALDRNPISTAEKLANNIRNSTTEDGEELDENVFNNTDIEMLLISAKNIQIRPCIEREGFLTKTPWTILQEDEFDLTFIIGSANHAGLIEALRHTEESIALMKENFGAFLPNDLVFDDDNQRMDVGRNIMNQYFSDGNITLEHSEQLSLYHTDALYLGPSVRVAQALVDAGATVFLYEFSFVGLLNKELVTIEDAPTFGAVRGDIVGYLFAQDGRMPAEGTEEKRMVELLAELWGSFLETSKPTASDIAWNPIEATNTNPIEEWVDIGAEAKSETGFHVDRLRLWAEVYANHFIERNATTGLSSRNYIVAIAFLYVTKSILSFMT